MKRQMQKSKIEWKEVELGEMIECLDSKRIPITESDRKKGKVPYYGANGQLDFVEDFIFDEELLLLAEDGGSWGYKQKCSYVINGKSWVNNHVHVLRVNSNLANIRFLMYWFNLTDLNRYISGTTRGKLNQKVMNKIKIPIPFLNGKPDLETQNKIVEILEKAEQLKEERKKAIEYLDDYLKSVFYEMFGDPVRNQKKWELVETQELFDMKLGKMLSAVNYTGKNLKPYLRNINVQWGFLDLRDIKEMDFDDKEFIKYRLKKGDILVCEGGEVGRTAIYNGEIEKCCYQNALHRLRVKDNKINAYYFLYYMMFAAKHGLILKDTIQVTIAHFTQDKFKKFLIMLPPIELQQTFASIVERVEKLKEKQKQSQEEIEILFNSLMQKAFKGELVR